MLIVDISSQKYSHFIFSSMFPLVRTTTPQSKSLNEIPRLVPPQAWYSHSATSYGTPSHNTSWTNASRLRVEPFAPAHLLNASRIRLNSLSDTANQIIHWYFSQQTTHLYFLTPYTSFSRIFVRYKTWFWIFRTHSRLYVTIITFLGVINTKKQKNYYSWQLTSYDL